MTMNEWGIIVLATAGTLFMLISAVGILRMPGIYARMHAVGKAATLGVGLLLMAAGFYFGTGEIWRMGALVLLFFFTSPVATTAMARAAYYRNPRPSHRLKHNDIRDPRYQPLTDREIIEME
ncbi:MAG: monovalent cation/H(+) antiporter subunit G [Caldilineaceae bacterium]|nr:monovalent cation/H(+) antiporter subunit G [Caldilineaceae bacterium]